MPSSTAFAALRTRESGQPCSTTRFRRLLTPKLTHYSDKESAETILDVTSTPLFVITLSVSGRCVVHDRRTQQPAYVIFREGMSIRSICYNRCRCSLIVLAVEFDRLQSFDLRLDKEGRACSWQLVLDPEGVVWPGFIELDREKELALTSCHAYVHTVWRFADYTKLFRFTDADQVKLGGDFAMVMYRSFECPHVRSLRYRVRRRKNTPVWRVKETHTRCVVHLCNLHNGQTVRRWSLLPRPDSVRHEPGADLGLYFLEHLDPDTLFEKHREGEVRVHDLATGRGTDIRGSHESDPGSFLFLYDLSLFLQFTDDAIVLWNRTATSALSRVRHTPYVLLQGVLSSSYNRREHILTSVCQNEGGLSVCALCILTGRAMTKHRLPEGTEVSCVYWDSYDIRLLMGTTHGDVIAL